MARKRNEYDYRQPVIGDCGHVCQCWPQVVDIGGRNARVICDDCTRAEYGIEDQNEGLAVWVRIKEPPKKEPAPRKPKKKTVPKPRNVLEQIIQDELF